MLTQEKNDLTNKLKMTSNDLIYTKTCLTNQRVKMEAEIIEKTRDYEERIK